MVTIKRYFCKMRKPLLWKGRKAFLRFAVLPAVVAIGVLVCVRGMVVTQYEMPYNRFDLDLLEGDRVVVSRLSYGWRTPMPQLFGTHRIGACVPKRGDLVAFSNGNGQQVLIERVVALAGDTIEIPSPEADVTNVSEKAKSGRFIISKGFCQLGNYIVPTDNIIGRVFGITYSINSQQPFYRCLRRERFLLKCSD